MKLFKTTHVEIVKYCQDIFRSELPSVRLSRLKHRDFFASYTVRLIIRFVNTFWYTADDCFCWYFDSVHLAMSVCLFTSHCLILPDLWWMKSHGHNTLYNTWATVKAKNVGTKSWPETKQWKTPASERCVHTQYNTELLQASMERHATSLQHRQLTPHESARKSQLATVKRLNGTMLKTINSRHSCTSTISASDIDVRAVALQVRKSIDA